MIIDFHTHIFPDSLAPRAIDKLSKSADIISYTDGTFHGLQDSMKQSGITYSVLLPVVTKPSQQEDVNRIAIQTQDFRPVSFLSEEFIRKMKTTARF